MRISSKFEIAALLLFLAFAANYLPDVGHGFIRDDVGWIGHNAILQARAGVFRPAVTASFALERGVCGISKPSSARLAGNFNTVASENR